MLLLRFMRLLPALAALLLPAVLSGAAPSDPAETPKHASLASQFLIAASAMRYPRFQNTVVVMVRHDRDGAMGIVINRLAGEQLIARLLEALGANANGATGTGPVFVGGPVQLELGFVLHSTDYRRPETVDVGRDVALTATPEIFRDIAAMTGPQKSLLVFGYAGWGAGAARERACAQCLVHGDARFETGLRRGS
ncbi:MAG: hypothetical protein EXQ83_08070 [Xanthobacteraceae bacterium]|nr:hypothetical protein [Xanthobacteraceae bacterium]